MGRKHAQPEVMGMKIWQKIFLAALSISILFVNVGIYSVFQLTYRKNLETEQRRGEVDFSVIRRNVQMDMQDLQQQNRLTEEAAEDLMELHEEDYKKQKIQIQLWKNGNRIYPPREEKFPFNIQAGQNQIVIRGGQGEKELVGVGELTGFQDTYYFYLSYPLEELNETWNQLFWIYLLISVGISVILVAVLSVMLHVLLQPLGKLTETVSDIRSGNYSKRVKVRGRDELAVFGENINAMAQTIEMNIEKLQEDNQRKEELVENLAHEMKSPITSIYGYAEYMMKSKVSLEESMQFCAIIMEESGRMKDMCYTLMDLSEIRRSEITYEKIKPQEFLDQIEQVIAVRQTAVLVSDPVKVIFQNLMGEGNNLYGNRRLLEILLLNLISNAIRACRQKREETAAEVSVSVSLKPTGEGVELRVSDNGIGIPAKKLDRLTDPFYRVDKGRSRENGGNGLGLSLCRQIVECHQGTMSFSSVEGEGTVVQVIFYHSVTFCYRKGNTDRV